MIPSPIILHIPHSSTVIPDDVVEQFVVSKQILQDQVNAITDLLTDELYGIGSYTKVAFPVSRLVVDPERFLDDSREPMSIKGLGVVYQKAPTNGIQLRRELSNKEKAALIKRYYRPHHAKLHKAVEQALRQYSRAIVVDCHSYNTEPLAWEGNHTLKRPEICLGVDDYHTPRRLAREVETLFTQRGYDVLKPTLCRHARARAILSKGPPGYKYYDRNSQGSVYGRGFFA